LWLLGFLRLLFRSRVFFFFFFFLRQARCRVNIIIRYIILGRVVFVNFHRAYALILSPSMTLARHYWMILTLIAQVGR